jgi:hypothetical protein
MIEELCTMRLSLVGQGVWDAEVWCECLLELLIFPKPPFRYRPSAAMAATGGFAPTGDIHAFKAES